MTMDAFPNRNTLWASLIVDSLAAAGVRHAVIGAGSRSTPLTLACAAHPDVQAHSVIDERSGGFVALGLAKASQQPVALVCTSGTAGANFFPAVIEAEASGVPLIVLTADRPPELHGSGANQTIDQIKLFGDHVRWFHEVALPEATPDGAMLGYLSSLGTRAVSAATHGRPGPVHLNLPFRPPLEPTTVEGDQTTFALPAPPRVVPAEPQAPTSAQLDALMAAIEAHAHGLIVAGPEALTTGDDVLAFARRAGYPVLADGLSGLRYGPWAEASELLTHYGSTLSGETPAPATLVLHFGGVPTSKTLNRYLAELPADTQRVRIDADGHWQDDSFRTTLLIDADADKTTTALAGHDLLRAPDAGWLAEWQAREQHARRVAGEHLSGLEARAVDAVLDALPEGGRLVVASSLPVRHLDDFGAARDKRLQVFANRGASGIDGTISTAAGVALARPDRPTVLVTGDLSLLHDLGGLLSLQRLAIPLTIVVINNDGGAIFERLPVRAFDPPYTDLFQTPHGLTFEHAAAQFGLDYVVADAQAAIRTALDEALGSGRPALIEVPSDGQAEEAARQAYLAAVREMREVAR